MERKDQWADLIKESSEYPDSLQKTVDKLNTRLRKENFRRWTRSSLIAAAVLLAFIILVNTSTAFAQGVSNIPILSAFAEFINLNKGLKSAIENDYVQKVNLSATDGDITLRLPYLIADDKNLVVFFQLPKGIKANDEDWFNIVHQELKDAETGQKLEGYSVSYAGISAKNMNETDGFAYSHYYFSESEIPKAMELTVSFEVERRTYKKAADQIPATDTKTNQVGQDEVYNADFTVEELGTFTYPITIDTSAIAAPKTFKVQKEQMVEGQKFMIEEVNIYPTGTEIYVTFSEDNSAWIQGLDLEVFSENNELLKGATGISSIGGGETGWTRIFIESNYFNTPKEQFLRIKGLRLINKDEEYITIDMKHKTITPQIDGLKLTKVVKDGDGAHLTFESVSKDGFGLFYCEYEDSSGQIYTIKEEGTSVDNNIQQSFIDVVYPEDGIIILKRSLSPMIELDSPIVIPLNP